LLVAVAVDKVQVRIILAVVEALEDLDKVLVMVLLEIEHIQFK
jgi:hypothetical protein